MCLQQIPRNLHFLYPILNPIFYYLSWNFQLFGLVEGNSFLPKHFSWFENLLINITTAEFFLKIDSWFMNVSTSFGSYHNESKQYSSGNSSGSLSQLSKIFRRKDFSWICYYTRWSCRIFVSLQAYRTARIFNQNQKWDSASLIRFHDQEKVIIANRLSRNIFI